jgi:hypothetical protein
VTEQMGARPGAFDTELAVGGVGPTTWRLLAPLIWTGTRGDTFTVPVGFVTDFATVPRFLHWLVSPYGAYTRAAVLHDWLLVELAEWTKTHPREGLETYNHSEPPANSRDADGIFRRVMEDLGVPWAKRWTMWAAVRLAALFNSHRAYGRDFWSDAPKVFGVGLLAAPVVTLGAVGVLLSLGLVRIVGLIQRPFSSNRTPDAPAPEEPKE